MNPDTVRKVCFFEITGENKRAVYSNRVDEPVEAGKHREKVKEWADIGKLPGGKPKKPDPGSKHPDRLLDILEGKDAAGTRAYAFRLYATLNDKHRLNFVRSQPFMSLPLNSVTGENFLGGFEFVSDEAGGWAYFLCDLDAVRKSELAERIRESAHAEGLADDSHALAIPFYFNLFDPLMQAAPWVVPAADRREGSSLPAFDRGPPVINHGGVHPDHRATRAAGPPIIINHGGVHPSAASFLIVAL